MNKFGIFIFSCLLGVVIGWFTFLPLQDKILAFAQVLENGHVDIEKQGVLVEDIVTNLNDGHYGSVSFKLIGDSKDTAEEITNREFQIRSFIIKELSKITKESLREESDQLEKKLKNHVNELLDKGEVLDVYLTEKLIQ